MASLYLHIPFCEKKCVYCDFYSIEQTSSMDEFLEALSGEIDGYAAYGKGVVFETVFFGGGTPSVLSPVQLDALLRHLREVYTVDAGAEITLETNPGTVTGVKLAAYRALGVNRLSIGVQSFHDDELKFLSRIHSKEEAVRCVRDARTAGFENVGIDLISSLPGQTMERWKSNLVEAVALAPDHISAYSLIVEDHTPLSKMVREGKVTPNPLEVEADLYEYTMGFLAAHGYEHYEVSNYALPGRRSRHNYSYWAHRNYLGFGPSAHSFWKAEGIPAGKRWWNVASVSRYCDAVRAGDMPVASGETVTARELGNERIFLGLRSDGLDLNALKADFNLDLAARQGPLIQQLVERRIAEVRDGLLRLTPKGYLLCDEIAGRLLV